ncbi:pilus assembly protein TadG-related protein [Methylobacterium sp. J-076]|uniref:pilus assembly protein TadG-related protein n=1 Tax=Methylobacterium sp. J-076 TaxID=2836655 RepID=UPI001FB94E46|nr:pilus assembly protein TadG-related protein [Methylobacterium sp. J-076]MCJ2011399.1 pilus assembly protein TadG-related protein [Methylobacterium sp. J-076]
MSRILTRARRAAARGAALARARGGNISIIFGLSLIPLVGLIGLGVDYGSAITAKTKLNAAADAAALAAVVTAKAYIGANPGQTNVTQNGIAAGVQQAVNSFSVNAGKVPYTTVALQTPVVTRAGQTLTSTVVYTATVQNNFGKIFRSPTTALTNTVTASVDLPSYLDFYLMVDVSGSMGLPATASAMAALAAKNTDMWSDYQQGCQFACHFPGYNGWTLAAGKIQLRSDAVNTAVCNLIQRASAPVVPNQYRVGIYPFIDQLATLAGLTSTMATLNLAAQCSQTWPLAFTNLLDTGATQLYTNNDPSTGTGSGGTHFEAAMPQMQALISNYGDGSTTAKPKPFVFLITDGMQNSQHFFTSVGGKYAYPGNPSKFTGYGNAWWDGSQPAQIDPTTCSALKTAGATISVLYIPYNQITFVNNSGGIAWENNRVNGFSPTLATPLKSCASPGYFYTANTPTDINNALSAMFDQALRVARITQ